ncbi:MAG: RNA polymerase sigma factor [Gammaproteobacteria bacterium]|nr:RNA polymerase sigma factor [Gammaproteobacteria bacterium]
MELIQQGDSAAFDELYQRYSQRLLYYFYRMFGGDVEKAQDFLHDLFLKIIEKPGQFIAKHRFTSWIFTVAHNMCKNEYRRLDVRKNSEDKLDATASKFDYEYTRVEKNIDQKIFENHLLKELTKLNPDYQTTFLLRFQENLTIKEISDIMECSEGTVKSRLFHTTRKLMNRLKEFNPSRVEA